MPILPKMPLKWFAKLNPKVDYEDLNNIVGNPEIDDIKWWLKLFDKNKEVFSVMVLWILSLRNGFAVGFPTTTYHMSLSNKLFSMKLLVILPYLIKKVKAGRVKELIYEQLTDKRNKTAVDCIILSGPTGSGKSSILKIIEQLEDYKILPVYTTREPRKDDKTRKAVSKAAFEKLGKLVYTTEYNGHRYGIVEEDLIKMKKQGKVALLDLPVGEKGLKDFILNPKYRISRYTLVYQDLKSATRMLNGRVETSGETPEMIRERIKKAASSRRSKAAEKLS